MHDDSDAQNALYLSSFQNSIRELGMTHLASSKKSYVQTKLIFTDYHGKIIPESGTYRQGYLVLGLNWHYTIIKRDLTES